MLEATERDCEGVLAELFLMVMVAGILLEARLGASSTLCDDCDCSKFTAIVGPERGAIVDSGDVEVMFVVEVSLTSIELGLSDSLCAISYLYG